MVLPMLRHKANGVAAIACAEILAALKAAVRAWSFAGRRWRITEY
jgi:hypothetical protein